ncbi:hypothetical protein GCM10023259_078830 [Thermocatellispora tengchongensis]
MRTPAERFAPDDRLTVLPPVSLNDIHRSGDAQHTLFGWPGGLGPLLAGVGLRWGGSAALALLFAGVVPGWRRRRWGRRARAVPALTPSPACGGSTAARSLPPPRQSVPGTLPGGVATAGGSGLRAESVWIGRQWGGQVQGHDLERAQGETQL